MLVGLLRTGKQVPPPPPAENEDDHEPGCPASKLAAGMGLRPASPPALPPQASPEIVHEALSCLSVAQSHERFSSFRPPDSVLYLTVCALRI
jgi:hypothetical protein